MAGGAVVQARDPHAGVVQGVGLDLARAADLDALSEIYYQTLVRLLAC